MNPPIVIYLETNWLVSCVLPHHVWRGEARQLFEDAKEGQCELRIPQIALIEARHVVANETAFHANAISTTADNLSNASRNLSRMELRHTVIGRTTAEMKPKDITDLYLLAAIAADRELNRGTRAAAFISTNSKEFSVRNTSTKLPRDFYSSRRIVYGDKFNRQSMERIWNEEVASGWPAPAPRPQIDERRKEAQRIINVLPENSLDKALEALKNIRHLACV